MNFQIQSLRDNKNCSSVAANYNSVGDISMNFQVQAHFTLRDNKNCSSVAAYYSSFEHEISDSVSKSLRGNKDCSSVAAKYNCFDIKSQVHAYSN